jgi:hypothetical protein
MAKMARNVAESETTEAQWARPNILFRIKWYPKYRFAIFTLSANFKSKNAANNPKREMAGSTVFLVEH